MKEIYKLISNFKIDKKYWNYINLSSEDYSNRSKPGPYIKLAIKVGKMLGLKNVVEIGSTRFAVSNKCIEYYNKDNEPFDSPPCCTDGHGGFFFTDAGFNVHTVDIDINCQTQIIWSYNNINKKFPENLKMHIPQDGIEFLKNFDEKIDILFLDGWDVGTAEYAEKHLEAYLTAQDKLSDVHLILIDDTDFTIGTGGKDSKLTPYLIENGYTLLFNGRQTLFINKTDVEVQPLIENEEVEEIYFIEENPSVVLTLTTTPNRLTEKREGWGVRPVIERLLNLSYQNYTIHFNVPYFYHKTGQEYELPEWLLELSQQNERLKIFRCNDFGSITKICPTIQRVEDGNTILITLDDDILYTDGFIEYHIEKLRQYPNTVLGFAGIGARDGSCHLCTTVQKDTEVRVIEGYKTVSYLRKYFKPDFFSEFVGKSWSDDIVLSAYLGKHKIKRVVLNYNKDEDFRARVESFPIVGTVPNEASGCNVYRTEQVSDNYDYFDKLGYFR
jgi:hypothetical protein